MNKQEAIDKIESRAFDIEDTDLVVGLHFALKTINQIDEPEKPIVPQFVADWYEENKDNFEYNLYRLCINFHERKLHEDLHEWFTNNKNKPIEVLILMNKYGYEVEKEKLYSARFKLLDDDVEECYINQTIDDKKFFLSNLDENNYVKVFFTQEELKN